MRNRKRSSRPKQRRHHRMLRMRMYTAPRLPQIKRIPKQRRARGLFEVLARPAEKYAVGMRGGGLRLGKGEDKNVFGEDSLLLDAGWGYIYCVTRGGNTILDHIGRSPENHELRTLDGWKFRLGRRWRIRRRS